jgi:hypothetical protein
MHLSARACHAPGLLLSARGRSFHHMHEPGQPIQLGLRVRAPRAGGVVPWAGFARRASFFPPPCPSGRLLPSPLPFGPRASLSRRLAHGVAGQDFLPCRFRASPLPPIPARSKSIPPRASGLGHPCCTCTSRAARVLHVRHPCCTCASRRIAHTSATASGAHTSATASVRQPPPRPRACAPPPTRPQQRVHACTCPHCRWDGSSPLA